MAKNAKNRTIRLSGEAITELSFYKRLPKSVENDRVTMFVESADNALIQSDADQIWFDLDDYKEAVYNVSNAKITAGRQEYLHRILSNNGLEFFFSRDGSKIGFFRYNEQIDDKLSSQALKNFYKKAGRR